MWRSTGFFSPACEMCLISIGKSLKRKPNCPVSSSKLLFQGKSSGQSSRVKRTSLVDTLMWAKIQAGDQLAVPLDVVNCTDRAVSQLRLFCGYTKMLWFCGYHVCSSRTKNTVNDWKGQFTKIFPHLAAVVFPTQILVVFFCWSLDISTSKIACKIIVMAVNHIQLCAFPKWLPWFLRDNPDLAVNSFNLGLLWTYEKHNPEMISSFINFIQSLINESFEVIHQVKTAINEWFQLLKHQGFRLFTVNIIEN